MPSLLSKSFKAPSRGGSSSVSVSYDYSELDRQDKLRDAAQSLDAKKADLLYKGDVGGMLALNQQKRGLLGELARPANVRVKSSSARSSSDSKGPEQSASFEQQPNLAKQAPAPEIPAPPKAPQPKKGAGDLLFDMPQQVGNNSFKTYV